MIRLESCATSPDAYRPARRCVIGEFHPEGPCPSGPPREHRLAPEKIQEWCEQAGLTVVGYRRQTPEHYVLFAQRGPDAHRWPRGPNRHPTLIKRQELRSPQREPQPISAQRGSS